MSRFVMFCHVLSSFAIRSSPCYVRQRGDRYRTAVAGSACRLQYKTNLIDAEWAHLPPDIIATGSTATNAEVPGAAEQRFHRIVVLPLSRITCKRLHFMSQARAEGKPGSTCPRRTSALARATPSRGRQRTFLAPPPARRESFSSRSFATY
jgi:hypothetical protein